MSIHSLSEDARTKLGRMIYDPKFSMADRENYLKEVMPTWLGHFEKLAPSLTKQVRTLCHLSSVDSRLAGRSDDTIIGLIVQFLNADRAKKSELIFVSIFIVFLLFVSGKGIFFWWSHNLGGFLDF